MGKLKIRVRPGSRKNKIEKMSDGIFKVWVKEPPEKGKANKELVDYLEEISGVPVVLKAGHKSKTKLIEFGESKEKFIKRLE